MDEDDMVSMVHAQQDYLQVDGGWEWDRHPTAAGPAPYRRGTDSLVLSQSSAFSVRGISNHKVTIVHH